MAITNELSAFNNFLSAVQRSKDIGLILVKNESESADFEKIMLENGFKESKNITDLLNSKKTFFTVRENFDKDIYDFMVQYPTSQVEIFNKKEMKSQFLNPDYANSAFIFIIDKKGLDGLRAEGFNIMPIVGPVYQI